MRQLRNSKHLIGAVLLTASIVACTACSAADDAARAYAGQLSRAVGNTGAKLKNPAPWLQEGKSASSQADDLSRSLASAPEGLTDDARNIPELSQALARAQQTQNAIREVDSAAAQAGTIGTGLKQDAALSARRHATGFWNARDEQTMSSLGEQVLKDVLCSMATDVLAPEEAEDVQKYPTAFSYLGDKSSEAITRALLERAAGRVSRLFGAGFKWGAYAADLADDAARHQKSIAGQISSPDWTLTRAYIFVVRNCMAPPTR